jgi:acetyltransferase-like isoleucine patch superfamily enzyme
VNQRVSVGHDARLDDFSQACPGAQINGFCQLGRRALIGSNASMHPGTAVGDRSVLAANSFLLRSIGPAVSAIGIPARQAGPTA